MKKKSNDILEYYVGMTQRKIYTHVIDGRTIRTTLSEKDLNDPKYWTLRSVSQWARVIDERLVNGLSEKSLL